MKITVARAPSQSGATIGKLCIDGIFACYTLEDVIREVPGQTVESWKVHGETAIPAGTYRVTLENSNRFGPDTLTINDVPGFQFIRMHAGNFAGLETFFKEVEIDGNKELLSIAEYIEVI